MLYKPGAWKTVLDEVVVSEIWVEFVGIQILYGTTLKRVLEVAAATVVVTPESVFASVDVKAILVAVKEDPDVAVDEEYDERQI